MSYTSRKPYLGLKDSIVELYKKPIRFLHESVQKESQFEKPYLGDDSEYQLMHFNIPAPDWPIIKWTPDPDPSPVGPGIGKPIGQCGHCYLVGWPVLDCDDPIEIHPLTYCTHTPLQSGSLVTKEVKTRHPEYPAGDPRLITYSTEGAGSRAGDTILRAWATVGKIKDIKPGIWSYLGPSIAVYVDPEIAEHTIIAEMIDGEGNRCYVEADVTCGCQCPASFSWDAANCDPIIDPSTGADPTATLTVIGGCPPYTWSFDGSRWGYTISPEGISDSLSATITCIASSCSGTGPTGYHPVPTVKVVDNCGTILTYAIRNSGGGWISIDNHTCQLPGEGTYVSGGWPRVFERIEDGKPWRQTQGVNFYGYSPSDCSDWDAARLAALLATCAGSDEEDCAHCIEPPDYTVCEPPHVVGDACMGYCTESLEAEYWWC